MFDAVADADLVDLGEQLVGGVTSEDVGGAGLDADADEREEALLLPPRRTLELVVAKLDARELERVLGMRLGERHRHVEVRDACVEAGVEDRDVETGSTPFRTASGLVSPISCAMPSLLEASTPCAEKRASSSSSTSSLGARGVVVGEGAVVEERPPRGDARERGADTSGPDDEQSHGATLLPVAQDGRARRRW